jgi:ribosomal protein S18 acetylase RimI-like enzyme
VIAYRDSITGIHAGHLQGFFVGWPNPPSPEVHLNLLAGSGHVVLAVDEETDRVVGFVTAITDGVLSAFIPFLEVLPSHQGLGIGRALMTRMLSRLKELYAVDLLCDPELQPFYEQFAMRRAGGMMHRNPDRQSGPPGKA